MIPGVEAPGQQRVGGGHAGGVALRVLRALQGSQLFLQLAHRRVGKAAVDEALVALAVAGGKAGHDLGREGRGHHQVGR